jgi:hypothetical protein
LAWSARLMKRILHIVEIAKNRQSLDYLPSMPCLIALELRHFSEQYLTSSQTVFHFFRH